MADLAHPAAARPTNPLLKLLDSDSESENGQVATDAPRTKLLAGLQPRLSDSTSESEDDEDDEGAYERVRQRLMAGSNKPEPQMELDPAPKPTEVASSEASEDDLPVRTNNTRRTQIGRASCRERVSRLV